MKKLKMESLKLRYLGMAPPGSSLVVRDSWFVGIKIYAGAVGVHSSGFVVHSPLTLTLSPEGRGTGSGVCHEP
jgi:hypothetical protein